VELAVCLPGLRASLTLGTLRAVLARLSSHALVQTGVKPAGSGHSSALVLMYSTAGTAGNLLGGGQFDVQDVLATGRAGRGKDGAREPGAALRAIRRDVAIRCVWVY
jgi:hypothetical protein